MATEVIMPKVDMDMSTGRISKWFFAEGDFVKKGDALFEIETDKAAMEIDAPADGRLANVTGKEGVDIAVGSTVAWISVEGEAAPSAKSLSTLASTPVSVEPQRKLESMHLVAKTSSNNTGAVRATPLARRLARESGIDLATVSGTGPYGRVVSADVIGNSGREHGSAATGTAAASTVESDQPTLMHPQAIPFPEGSYTLQPHSTMRRTIARRLVEAKSTVPHFYLGADCRIDALLKLRTELNAAAPNRGGEPAFKLSVNDLVIKAYAKALSEIPGANVSWSDDNLICHENADVGVAVSIAGGLITPIIRRAETKSLSTISNEMKNLAVRARAGKLKPDEYQGGTGAVSNLGMFGVREFAAIINPPHASILAVGAGERRPVVDNDDNLVAATVMSVTLSVDHRAVDGALGAEILGRFCELISNPLSLLV